MTRDELQHQVTEMRETAQVSVRQYAKRACPHVAEKDIVAIVAALGEISVDEALAALDALQAEAMGRR